MHAKKTKSGVPEKRYIRGDKKVLSNVQMITPICKLVEIIWGLSILWAKSSGTKNVKNLQIIRLHHWWRIGLNKTYNRRKSKKVFDFDCNPPPPQDVITLHVVFLSVALSSSPPVSSTQYCLPFHCHKVNKQWISSRAAPRNNARCTVQRKSKRVKSVISLLETSTKREREKGGGIWERKDRANQTRTRYGLMIKTGWRILLYWWKRG